MLEYQMCEITFSSEIISLSYGRCLFSLKVSAFVKVSPANVSVSPHSLRIYLETRSHVTKSPTFHVAWCSKNKRHA